MTDRDAHLPPDFAELVQELRQRGKAMGEFEPRSGDYSAGLSPEDSETIVRWVRDGGYQEAVAAVIAEHPELANE